MSCSPSLGTSISRPDSFVPFVGDAPVVSQRQAWPCPESRDLRDLSLVIVLNGVCRPRSLALGLHTKMGFSREICRRAGWEFMSRRDTTIAHSGTNPRSAVLPGEGASSSPDHCYGRRKDRGTDSSGQEREGERERERDGGCRITGRGEAG